MIDLIPVNGSPMSKEKNQNGGMAAIIAIGGDNCTGCGGCIDCCPTGALTLSVNEEGYYRSVVDGAYCIQCGLCASHCPIVMVQKTPKQTTMEPIALGAWSNQDEIRLSSSSGGIAYELGYQTIRDGGIVVGCAMGDDLLAHHIIVDNLHDLSKLQGSKYIPSKVSGVYKQAAQTATKGRKVLFTGTPCQVAAFESYLRPEDRERVLTVGLVCHGVPSLLFWKKHLAESFAKDVRAVEFRNKKYGWSSPSMVYELPNRKGLHIASYKDVFYGGFGSTIFHQPICTQCPFVAIPHCGDLILGDFWGVVPKWNDKKGVSVVVMLTERGLDTIEQMRSSGRISAFNSTLAEAAANNPRLIKSAEKFHPRRTEAMRMLMNGAPLNEIVKLYQPRILKRVIKKYMPIRVWVFAKHLKNCLMLYKQRLS
jgi:coenzyme F420-reducing hydrogenase beta subunit